MPLHVSFDNSYARLPAQFFAAQSAAPVSAPQLIAFNAPLAQSLGITAGTPEEMGQIFAGNVTPDGATPLAQAYAGHQFGGFSPQLGDGRALLLGEGLAPDGRRYDLQLKGSGRTPFSRNGDGRAWLGPVLREYVVSEAMHALGVPTTRALAAVVTGDKVYREQGALPGAILTRVASSHIRVGTFQYFAARRDASALQTLIDYTIARHYPDANGPAGLLTSVIAQQAELVAHWMALGFIHGVMNTDNTSLSGETIDYGPCAFLDTYHPATVFSSIDAQGRYAYDNQPNIIVWNMAQLATSLIPLMPDQDAAVEQFTEIVHAMPAQIEAAWLRRFRAKLGLSSAQDGDMELVTSLLETMAENRADFTNMFRSLAKGTARDTFLDPTAFDAWEPAWRKRLQQEKAPQTVMQANNPAFIPRNHRIEQMIQSAVAGDYAPFERLIQVLARPYDDQPQAADLAQPPLASEVVQQTFCGT